MERVKGLQGVKNSWGGILPYLIHVQLHRVPHLQVLRGHSLMEDEASTDLGPGHGEQHILGEVRDQGTGVTACSLSLPLATFLAQVCLLQNLASVWGTHLLLQPHQGASV